MNAIVLFMARYRVTWVLWLLLGLIPVSALAVLDFAIDTFRHWWAMWRCEWRGAVVDYARLFTDRHRRSLRSLGSKPARGGTLWTHKR